MKFKHKKNHFTIIEVLVAGVIISVAIYAFNASLGTTRRSLAVTKVSMTTKTIAYDYAKRYSQLTYQELGLMGNGFSNKDLPYLQEPSGSVEKEDEDPNSGLKETYVKYDLTPHFTSGKYSVLIEDVLQDLTENTLNGPVVTRTPVAKKVTVTVAVNVAQPGLGGMLITESASVYVYDLL